MDQRRQIWASGRGGQCETEPLLRDGPDTAHSHLHTLAGKIQQTPFWPQAPWKAMQCHPGPGPALPMGGSAGRALGMPLACQLGPRR